MQKLINKDGVSASSANMTGNICTFIAKKYTNDRIVDTGATNHMVCTPHMLSSITSSTNPIKDGFGNVYLPDGSQLPIIHTGKCTLGKEEISNILCVPGFKLNLLSISQLTKELGFS